MCRTKSLRASKKASQYLKMKNLLLWLSWLLCLQQHSFPSTQAEYLPSSTLPEQLLQHDDVLSSSSSVYIGHQQGLKEADQIVSLPEQPPGVKLNQYSGYVTVDPKAGRSLFYYFAESPHNSSAKPLVLYLAGGPGCSSLAFGGFLEIGPFNIHRKNLHINDYAWTKVANVLFLESPAGVGFSYSNTSSDYKTTGDKRTAEDAYTFLINWLERFPEYKNRPFYISGISYGGRFASQLAYTILAKNKKPNHPFINLKHIAIGSPYLDASFTPKGNYEYLWTHAMNSDQTHAEIMKHCDFATGNYSDMCKEYMSRSDSEAGSVLRDQIYSHNCNPNAPKPKSPGSGFDECSRHYAEHYFNRKDVKEALHAINTNWTTCSKKVGRIEGNWTWTDSPRTVLPVLKQLIANNVKIWIFSGDADAIISVTSARMAINSMDLPVVTSWRPWISNQEVGGYLEGYEGLTLLTIRGAGHESPSYQPERALTLISSFLQGKLPPSV